MTKLKPAGHIEGKIRLTFQPVNKSCAVLEIAFGGFKVGYQCYVQTTKNGVVFDHLFDFEKIFRLEKWGFPGELMITLGESGTLWVEIRPEGCKRHPVAGRLEHGTYNIVQAADGLGFIRSSNQPEFYPPTRSLELPVNIRQSVPSRSFGTDPRPVLLKVQTPLTRFKSHPLPPVKRSHR